MHVLRRRPRKVLDRRKSQQKNPTSPRKSKKPHRANRGGRRSVFCSPHESQNNLIAPCRTFWPSWTIKATTNNTWTRFLRIPNDRCTPPSIYVPMCINCQIKRRWARYMHKLIICTPLVLSVHALQGCHPPVLNDCGTIPARPLQTCKYLCWPTKAEIEGPEHVGVPFEFRKGKGYFTFNDWQVLFGYATKERGVPAKSCLPSETTYRPLDSSQYSCKGRAQ